ncbi:MAG: hypothetical protein JWO53_139 [Chlamydiia bacterium]|nr:hypothetical protein [Chlamydiia bacterium]
MEFKTDSVAFRLLKATSRVDNPASSKILRSVGMKFIKSEEKFGALREHFEKQIFTRPVDLIAKLCESPTDSELKLLIEKTLSSKEG